jgi:hypothetical protein
MRKIPLNTRTIMVALLALAMVLPMLKSCFSDPPKPIEKGEQQPNNALQSPVVDPVDIPAFNADSAYYFVKKQVDFGSRVPNSPEHEACAAWIVSEFERMGLTVIQQKFDAVHYDGTILKSNNIIAQYKPENPNRVLMAAHWDSRFQADQDTKRKNQPILGADDGASGVGVLLELARTLQNHPLEMGVDFICFDAEDQGNDVDDGQDHSRTWCLGSQHWAQNLHRSGYSPQYGILLDMVGAPNPRFDKEGISRQVAPIIVDRVWATAADLGYGDAFVQEDGQGITDDHLFVIQHARIPMIDIINRPGVTQSGFVSHWHTHDDNMSAIDKNTLKMVGEVCTSVIYQTHNGTFFK